MLFQAPQERKEDNTKGTHFHYLSIKPGESVIAYVAARTLWLYTHTEKRKTKLCVYKSTGGTLACPYCEALRPLSVRGWFCGYRASDGRPIAVWLNEESRVVCDKLTLHERVILTREKTPCSPVSVLPSLAKGQEYQTTLPERKNWADGELSLLRLVQQPELVQWAGASHPETLPMENAIPQHMHNQVVENPPTALEITAAHEDGPLADAIAALQSRIGGKAASTKSQREAKHSPSANGKHE